MLADDTSSEGKRVSITIACKGELSLVWSPAFACTKASPATAFSALAASEWLTSEPCANLTFHSRHRLRSIDILAPFDSDVAEESSLTPNIVFPLEQLASYDGLDVSVHLRAAPWLQTLLLNAFQHELTRVQSDPSNTQPQPTRLTLLLPARVAVFAGIGAQDTLCEVASGDVPLPADILRALYKFDDTNNAFQNLPQSTQVDQNKHLLSNKTTIAMAGFSHRAKTWRLAITHLHPVAVVVTLDAMKKAGNKADLCPFAWSIVRTEHLAHAPRGRCIFGLNGCLWEASIDVDFAQELHLCTNASYATKIVLSQQHPSLSMRSISLQSCRDQSPLTLSRLELSHWKQQSLSWLRQSCKSSGVSAGIEVRRSPQPVALFQGDSGHIKDAVAQRLHVMPEEGAGVSANLATNVAVSSEAEELAHRSEEISSAVLINAKVAVTSAAAIVADIVQDIARLQQEQTASPVGRRWWLAVLEQLRSGSAAADSFLRDLAELIHSSNSGSAYTALTYRVGSLPAVGAVLNELFLALWTAHKHVMHAMQHILSGAQPSAAERQEAANCRKCKSYFGRTGAICSHCLLHKKLQDYADHLRTYKSTVSHLTASLSGSAGSEAGKRQKSTNAGHRLGTNQDADGHQEGRDNPIRAGIGGSIDTAPDVEFESTRFQQHEVPACFGMLVQQLRRVSGASLGEAGRTAAAVEMQLLEKLKRHYQSLVSAWARYQTLLNVHDELRMCQQRLYLLSPGEKKPVGEEDAACWAFELAPRYGEHYSAVEYAAQELVRAKGNLRFFRSQLQAFDETRPDQNNRTSLHPDDTTPQPSNEGNPLGRKPLSDCPICMEPLRAPRSEEHPTVAIEPVDSEQQQVVVVRSCGHCFHHECIQHWMRKKMACPLCKMKIKSATDLQEISHDSAGDLVVNPEAERLSSVMAPAAVKGSAVAAALPLARSYVRGQWGAKIDCLVSDLKSLGSPGNIFDGRDTSEDKVIVFCQWPTMLDLVAEALQANVISYIYCSEASHFLPKNRMWRFQHDAAVRVLLLPLHFGAEGLDVTEANHVVLLEPLLNQATEKQAVGRIDRLGQSRPCYVHHYICTNTIEEKMLRLRQVETGSAPGASVEAVAGSAASGDDSVGSSSATSIVAPSSASMSTSTAQAAVAVGSAADGQALNIEHLQWLLG